MKRNLDRFPSDFMFQLNREEYNALRFQSGILEKGKHSKYLPHAFTEQGIAMLSSVLRSSRAVRVNIEIMRAFVRIRQTLMSRVEMEKRMDQVEKILLVHDDALRDLYEKIGPLLLPPSDPPSKRIGFHVREKRPQYMTFDRKRCKR